jgi:Protein of unknown function (DUF2971)
MIDVPPRLYKYMPPERASSVLGKLQIRFSQASVMNDIEEYKPPINALATSAVFREKFFERADVLYPGLRHLIEKQAPGYMKKQHDQGEQNLPLTIKKIYEINDRNFGILSLSDLPTSVCMWEKYADHGRGLLVEFDSSHAWFNQRKAEDDDFRHLRRISYVADRTPTFLLGITAQSYFYTKEAKWEYESEWRLILNFNSAACKAGKDNTGTDVLLFAIPPGCLLSVTVGYNARPELIQEIRTTLAGNPALSHVRLNAAKQFGCGSVEIRALDAA